MRNVSYNTFRVLPLAVTCLAAAPLQADWQLDPDASSLFYVTSKASAISEVNSFTSLSGGIADSGEATLTIDLASVSTAIEIRDQRMREMVFEVVDFPSASVTLSVDTAALNALKAGESIEDSWDAAISLHGEEQTLTARLGITKLADDSLRVHTVQPLLVSAGSFGLAEGVEQLREVAGLPAINPNAVVNFTLVYRP